jgi:RNA polymerase sigma-70 factor (ECF subfamily)
LSQLSDEKVINEIKAGNKEYFSQIIKRYNQRLYRIAISYGMSDDDCDEVLQSTYIAAYEKLSGFRSEAKFSTWLIRILINECLMLKRKQKKTVRISEEKLVTIPAGDHLNPQKMFMTKERKEILENAIKQLPEKYKTVYILKEIEGMNIAEAAETLAISEVNVKVRLHRARTLLKDIISGISDLSNLFTFGNERCDRINNVVMNYIRKEKNSLI